MKKTFISDFTGICNRLEALALAYLIRDHYGHEIFLDWPELGSFQVLSVRHGSLGWLDRFKSIKVRDCPDAVFESLGDFRTVILRSIGGGPATESARAARRVAGDLRLDPQLGRSIREVFAPAGSAPRKVIGVHLRRGDFTGIDEPSYDSSKRRSVAVPDWWYVAAMRRLQKRYPDAAFYLSGTGNPAAYAWTREFECLRLEARSPYTYKGEGHASETDPLADLFALASCPIILATPTSSFSHWAAHILGPPSQILMPPVATTRDNPEMVRLAAPCPRLLDWLALSRQGGGTIPVDSDQDLPEIAAANVDWF